MKELLKRDFENKLFIERNRKLFLNVPYLFPDNYKNCPIMFLPTSKKIKVFYRRKHAVRLKPFNVRKYINVDSDFLVGLGIYFAEGSRNRKPKITNSEPKVINQAIKFFEQLSLNLSLLRASIQLHERSDKSFEEVKEFWLSKTNLTKDNIVTVRIKKSTGNAKVKKYGVVHLESTFLMSQILVKGILDNLYIIIGYLTDEQIIYFLQGAFAGEGYVNICKSGSVNTIQYTTTNTKERRLIKSLLIRLGIKVHENSSRGNLQITGYFNIKKLVDADIFEYHPWRRKRLSDGFRNLEKNNIPGLTRFRILNVLSRNPKSYISTTQMKNLFCFSRGPAKTLKGLYLEGKIKRIKGSGKIPHKWSLS